MLKLNREEKKGWICGAIGVTALVIEAVCVFGPKTAVSAAPTEAIEEIVEETAEMPEKGQIRSHSAMPCEDAESFRRWYEEHRRNYEPETAEESRNDGSGTDHESDGEKFEEAGIPETGATEVESTMPPLYRIDGETIDASIQERLYSCLQDAGIGYWYEGALAQMYQESRGQQYAVNQNNHEDMGLFQYKSRFWDWSSGDIFDIDAQLRRYTAEMAARFNAGLTVDEAISRHNTSDHVATINWEYVGQVKQWLDRMEEIR